MHNERSGRYASNNFLKLEPKVTGTNGKDGLSPDSVPLTRTGLSKTFQDKQFINTKVNYCYCCQSSNNVDLCFSYRNARWGCL